MKVTFVVVGKTNEQYLTEGIENYARRINRYCRFEQKVIPELKNTKSMPVELQMNKEAEAILQEMGNYQECILLDERGKLFTSSEFATYIEKKMLSGQREIAFFVGGPYGFDEKVKKTAHGSISLSPMTFSHQLIRLIFVEQLYRAFTIIKGEPYHNP